MISDAGHGNYGQLKFAGICLGAMAVIALPIAAGRLFLRVAGRRPFVTTAIVAGGGWYWFHNSTAVTAPAANPLRAVIQQSTKPATAAHRKKNRPPNQTRAEVATEPLP